MSDKLAPFRKRGAVPADAAILTATGEPNHYRAYAVSAETKKRLRLELRQADGPCVARLYSNITEISYNRATYSELILAFGAKKVKVRGKGLRPVIEALLDGTCEYLAERDENDAPSEGVPVIDNIDIMTL